MPITIIPSIADTITKDGRTSLYTVGGFTETTTIHADFTNISAQTAFMLIDLSDTTNWKHTETGHINIEYISIQIDPDAAYLGSAEIGFLSSVDATNGDFNEVIDIDMAKKSDILVETLNFGSHGLDCEEDHHFGLVIADSTLFQIDVNLEGPDGNTSYPAGNGDLCLVVERSAGSVDVSITIGYETVA